MLSDSFIVDYEITPLTMAVLANENELGLDNALIIEEDCEYNVEHWPTKIIDEACKFFGSSLRGRLEGTRDVANITHKAPIAIDPSSGMYFFPTSSPSNKNCSWISHTHVKKISQYSDYQTKIFFINEKRIILNVSYGSMMNQLQRTAQFRYSLDTRMVQLRESMPKNKRY